MTRKTLTLVAISLLMSPFAAAQMPDLRQPVIVDAERTDYDGRTSMTVFTGLRLTQGNIGIVADLAQTSRMDFDDSVWRFSGNVVFDVDDGQVTCDSADLRFSEFQLMVATITGTPATFEFRRQGTDQTTYAEANRLYYDLVAGTIEFTGDATITEGGNVITSETLIYNIRDQRINASGNGDERVTVTYTPPDPEDAAPDTDDAAGGEADEPAADEEAVETTEDAAEPEAGLVGTEEDAQSDEPEAVQPEDGSE